MRCRHPSLTFHNFIFSSETTGPNRTKLDTNNVWKVLCKFLHFMPIGWKHGCLRQFLILMGRFSKIFSSATTRKNFWYFIGMMTRKPSAKFPYFVLIGWYAWRPWLHKVMNHFKVLLNTSKGHCFDILNMSLFWYIFYRCFDISLFKKNHKCCCFDHPRSWQFNKQL